MQITVFGEGNGNLLQYFCLGNPMDRKAWQATVQGVVKSHTQLGNSTTVFLGSCVWRCVC